MVPSLAQAPETETSLGQVQALEPGMVQLPTLQDAVAEVHTRVLELESLPV